MWKHIILSSKCVTVCFDVCCVFVCVGYNIFILHGCCMLCKKMGVRDVVSVRFVMDQLSGVCVVTFSE